MKLASAIPQGCSEPTHPITTGLIQTLGNATATGTMEDNAFIGNGRIPPLPKFSNYPKEKQTHSGVLKSQQLTKDITKDI